MRTTYILLSLLLYTLVPGYTTRIIPHGNLHLADDALVRLSGLSTVVEPDSESLTEARAALSQSGLFDTVYLKVNRINDTASLINLFIREKKASEWSIYGGTLSLTMHSETKFWFAVTPGYERHFLFGKPQTLLLTFTLPYMYGVSAHWRAPGCLFPSLTLGASAGARSAPSTNSRYYFNTAWLTAYAQKHFNRRLSATLTGAGELTRTWLVDLKRWKALEWQVWIPNPDDISDFRFSHLYPRTERVPSVTLSAAYDHRDNTLYPTSGFDLFAESKRVFVENLRTARQSTYDQATLSARGYLHPGRRHILAGLIKAIARNHFDPATLSHRLLFYDDTQYFRGFNTLAGTHMGMLNLEYRFRLFTMNMNDLMAELPMKPAMRKRMLRFSYSADAILFADNGLFCGRVVTDSARDIPFEKVSLKNDMFTSVGIGGKIVYPGLGYVVTGALMLYQRKPGLPEDYFSRLYAAVSMSF